MTPAAFRKLALSMPGAHKAPHFERTSFRVGKRIFATMKRTLIPALALALFAGGAALAGPEASHTGVVKTKRFEIHYRPGSRAAADVDRQAVAAERDLDRIAAALDTTPKGPFALWLYDDVWELSQVTGTKGNAGFSAVNASHIPFDDDQTRLHELVHIVAYEWPKSGPEARNLFLAEGLANAVLEFVHGVHVHAVAAHYRRAGRLPPLSDMTDAPDFYAWIQKHPAFDAYDVAASWMRYLLDRFGTAKAKLYYTGTPAKTAFGSDVATLEKAWHALLDKYPLRPEVETLLKQRDGEDSPWKPSDHEVLAALLAKPDDWTPILARDLSPEKPDRWKREGNGLAATNPADEWTACDLGKERYGDCIVHARVSTTGYTPVQIRFGSDNQLMFVAPGTFLFRGEQPLASDPLVKMALGPTKLDIVVARRGPHLEVWVDGVKALNAEVGTEGPLHVGIGIHKGAAIFEDVRVRLLR